MQQDGKDVGFLDDGIFFLQHAVAAENHCVDSYALTKEPSFLELAQIIRRKRSKFLSKFVKEGNGQAYCISKHVLGCAQGLKEMGSRFSENGDKELAEECIQDAMDFQSIFIFVNQDKKKEVKYDIQQKTTTSS